MSELPLPLSQGRMKICVACEHYISFTKMCSKCGCFMPLKTKLSFERCPIGKWGKPKKKSVFEK